MTKYISLKDTNTKEVLQWRAVKEDGTEVVKDVPKAMWKRERDWSKEEIAKFLGITEAPEKTAEPQDVLEARVSSVNSPQIFSGTRLFDKNG